MKRATLLGMLLLVPGLAAQAQVAAPGLLPFANPSTLAWELAPFVSATLLRVEQSALRNDTAAPDRAGSGWGLLLRSRWPGDTVALGASALDARVTLGDESVGTTRQALRTLVAGLAVRSGDSAAFGLGVESISEREATATADLELGTLTPMVGLSLRFAEVFYLASVYGRRRLVSNITTRDGQERNMTRVGVGLRWLSATALLHAEYSREESPPFREVSFPAAPGFTFDVLDTQIDTTIAEVVWQGLLIGYSAANTQVLGMPLRSRTVHVELVSLGFMQPHGWSLTVTRRIEQTEDRVRNTDERLAVLALGALWRF